MDFVKTFYSKKSMRYGGFASVDWNGTWTLLRIAIEEDNLSFFEEILSIRDKLVGSTHVNWLVRYAEFYLKHNKVAGAIAFYKNTVQLNPTSVKAIADLANAYTISMQKSDTKAVQFAETQSH
jgi:hypothetical protein